MARRPRADNGMYTSPASMLNAAASSGSRSTPDTHLHQHGAPDLEKPSELGGSARSSEDLRGIGAEKSRSCPTGYRPPTPRLYVHASPHFGLNVRSCRGQGTGPGSPCPGRHIRNVSAEALCAEIHKPSPRKPALMPRWAPAGQSAAAPMEGRISAVMASAAGAGAARPPTPGG